MDKNLRKQTPRNQQTHMDLMAVFRHFKIKIQIKIKIQGEV